MRPVSPLLKSTLEYGPLLAFFAVFMLLRDQTVAVAGRQMSGIVFATLVFVPLLVASTLAMWALTRRLSAMQVMTLVLVVVFGGLSVWLNDPRFFKMKPTMIYLLFAALLGISLMLRRNWLGSVLGDAVPLQAQGWRVLTMRLAGLFIALAAANEAVWRTQSDGVWVSFKTFGLPVLMVLFFVANAGLFSRYAAGDSGTGPGRD